MRRADREILAMPDIGRIVADCRIVHVAYADEEGLTVVPLNFGYRIDDGRLTLYFHSAPYGRRLDAIRAAGNDLPVAFDMATDCAVIEGRTPCNWGESYRSVVGTGRARLVEPLEERREGLRLIMAQQAAMPDVAFTDNQANSVAVWRIDVDHCTGKINPPVRGRA